MRRDDAVVRNGSNMRAPTPRRQPRQSPASTAAPVAVADEEPTDRYLRKREEVLAAAALTFNELGIGGGTLSGIAQRVGLATNSVTYYFRRKQDLVAACFLRAIEAHLEDVRHAARQPTVAARVEACLVRQASLLADIATGARPPLVVFSELRTLEGRVGADLHRAYTELFREMRGLLVGPETAALSRADLNARAHMLLSAFHMLRVWLPRVEPDQYERVAARAADIMLRGMGDGGSRWPAGDSLGSDWTLVDGVDTPGDRFLRAATDLLNEKGYRGASVDRISARLNVTKGSFYHHIEHKDDLILACFERTLTAVRRATAQAQALSRPGWEQACAMARSLACLQTSGMGPLLRVGALGALPAFDGRAQAYRRMFQLTERIRDLIVTGMMDGSIRPLDSGIAAHLLGGSINSIAELHHWLPPSEHHRLVDLCLKPVFEGLLAPPA